MVPFDYEKEYEDKGKEWMEGYKARLNGKKDYESPYLKDSDEEDRWISGWITADTDDEKEE